MNNSRLSLICWPRLLVCFMLASTATAFLTPPFPACASTFNQARLVPSTNLHVSSPPTPRQPLQNAHDDGDNDQRQFPPEQDLGDIQIPSTGVSITDEMEQRDKDRFVSELVPITGLLKTAAQIVTTATERGSFEPVRYLVSLTPPSSDQTTKKNFVLVDIPPFSTRLVAQMQSFMGENSTVVAMLVTSRDAIHYDDAPAVYRMRRTDLDLWLQAFPEMAIVGYRLDVPRDCREAMTQVLDGYGPWAWEEEPAKKLSKSNDRVTFVETGRPLTVMEWDHDIATDILRGRLPLDAGDVSLPDDGEDYTPESIRAKEANKHILAVYTPGHSFGSISYVFPEVGLCCSGYTIPVEDNREEENKGREGAGPAMDCRGYITTSRGGLAKQMESARHFVNTYCDRFDSILPSRGDPLFLGGNDLEAKKQALLEILDQYDKIGKIYEELGIMSPDDSS